MLENALLSDTKNFIIYYYLGEIAEKNLEFMKAIFYFEKTIKLNKKNFLILFINIEKFKNLNMKRLLLPKYI